MGRDLFEDSSSSTSGGDGAAKVASKKDVSTKGDGVSTDQLDQEKVEKIVTKAKSRAQAVQAVKRAVLDVQLVLLDGVKSEDQLESSSALLTQSEYQDVVVERSIDKKCGYPLCGKPLWPESQRKGRFRISVSEHKIYDARETGMFCSQTCLVRSKTFAVSLQVERDGLVQQEKIIAIVREIRDFKSPASDEGESTFTYQQSDRAVDSLLSEVKERQDSEISSFEDAGPSSAIEGYTPICSIRDWRLKREAQQQASVPAGAMLGYSEAGFAGITSSAVNVKPLPVKSISVSSPEKGKSAVMTDSEDMNTFVQSVPIPKSILKKSNSERTIQRNVSWGDQKMKGDLVQKMESKAKLKAASKPRRQVKEMPQPPKATRATVATTSTFTRSAASASASVSKKVESERTRGVVEDKAAIFEGIQRLSVAEQPTKEAGLTVCESILADAADAEFESVHVYSAVESATRCTGSVSSSEGQISKTEVNCDSKELLTDAEARIAERLASAKDVAAALTEAAEATAAGNYESSVAVAMAGLSIVSKNETHQNLSYANSLEEATTEDTLRAGLKWPEVEPEEEDDSEVSSSKAGWHDTAPKNFKLEISMFGTIWMSLEEWISAATIAFIYGKEEQPEEDFLSVNGREYRMQVVCGDGKSAEISRAFSICVARVLPDVVQALGIRAPISSIEHALGRMVRTMSFVEPLPAFGVNHWRMLIMLFLEGLSVDQVGAIGVHLSKRSSHFRNLLISTGTSEEEYVTFRGVLLPSGRLLSASTRCAG